MKKLLLTIALFAVILYLCLQINGYTQPSPFLSPDKKGLFDNDTLLEITLNGNLRELLNDRSDNPKYHPLTLIYTNEDSSTGTLPVEVKTRGHFRKLRENCVYPPLSIHFIKSDALQKTIFIGQDKLKLVLHCQGEEYIVREWLVYKLYNLVAEKSFKTRLVRIKLNDDKRKKEALPFYGILLEDEKQMAKRFGEIAVERKINPDKTEEKSFLTMSVFQYLIGNTDWSVQYLQNIKLMARDSFETPIAVPYDFDHSGMVSAPYAHPADELMLGSVRERVYRGYCITDMKKFEAPIALFNRIKPAIYSLYTNCGLLNEKYKKATVKYLDEFYSVINNPVAMQKEFSYPCDKKGTGNVIIKGMKEEE